MMFLSMAEHKDQIVHHCLTCQRPGAQVACRRCLAAYYCSAECQSHHNRQHNTVCCPIERDDLNRLLSHHLNGTLSKSTDVLCISIYSVELQGNQVVRQGSSTVDVCPVSAEDRDEFLRAFCPVPGSDYVSAFKHYAAKVGMDKRIICYSIRSTRRIPGGENETTCFYSMCAENERAARVFAESYRGSK